MLIAVLQMVLGGPVACSLSHKDAAKVVDPDLRIDGRVFEAQDDPKGYRLGPYVIEKHGLTTDTAPPPKGSSTAAPADRIVLEASLRRDDRHLSVRCEALRSRTALTDYGAMLGESQDAIEVDCDLVDDSGEAWHFTASGSLSNNLAGRLQPESGTITGGFLPVEILLWRKRFDTVRRHLPAPVVQVRIGREAIVAMILDRPVRAWIATDAPAAFVDVSVATMAALDLMPLGFAG